MITDAFGLPKRRGRRLGPICKDATPEHCEWLVPLREMYIESEFNYRELKTRALTSPAQLSRLLTGAKDYPDLVRVLDVYRALSTKVKPSHCAEWYQKTWEAGAWAAERPEEWIKDCIARLEKHSADDAEAPDADPAGRGSAVGLKPLYIRFPRAISCLAGVLAGTLLTTVLHALVAGTPDGSVAAPTPRIRPTATYDTAACDSLGRCLTSPLVEPAPAPARDDRRYVTYPAPAPSPGAPAGTAGAWWEVVFVPRDTPVYDSNRRIKKEGSRAVYVGAGSTVYARCADAEDFLVIYAGNGDRIRPDSVRWIVETDGSWAQDRVPYEPSTKCSNDMS